MAIHNTNVELPDTDGAEHERAVEISRRRDHAGLITLDDDRNMGLARSS